MSSELPQDLLAKVDQLVQEFAAAAQSLVTRKASQFVLEKLQPSLGELIGGSADLSEVALALAAQRQVAADGVAARLVSPLLRAARSSEQACRASGSKPVSATTGASQCREQGKQ